MSTDRASEETRVVHRTSGGLMSGGYGLAFIGAVVYYVQHAHTFGEGVLGVLKAIVWPAILVYGLLEHLGK
jgi:hypothetical protein